MNWIDINTFLRNNKDSLPGFKNSLILIFCTLTLVGLPGVFYAMFIRGPRTKSKLKKQFYDIEDTTSSLKIGKSINGKYGLVWWEDCFFCNVILDVIYDQIQPCENGIYIVKMDGKYGLFNYEENKFTIPIKHTHIKFIGDGKYKLDNKSDSIVNKFGERTCIS